LLNNPRRVIDSIRTTSPSGYGVIDETAFDSGMIPFMRCAPGGCRHFCLHETGSWSRIWVIGAIASSEASVDGSKFLGVLSSLASPSSACFIMDDIAFHKSIIGWNIMRLCMQQAGIIEALASNKRVIVGCGT